MSSREFDPQRVGQQLYPSGQEESLSEAELLHEFGSNRDWFNTSRVGCSNDGHDYWPRIKTDANRTTLIEYLKTL
jgi:hypothetical protein